MVGNKNLECESSVVENVGYKLAGKGWVNAAPPLQPPGQPFM